jgi:hypothetical protein
MIAAAVETPATTSFVLLVRHNLEEELLSLIIYNDIILQPMTLIIININLSAHSCSNYYLNAF